MSMNEEGRSPKRRVLEEDAADLEVALNPAKNYPRKRVAVACEVCRLRKTKCDAKRPCSFCTEAGIECVYRQHSNGDKGVNATDVLLRIEERLSRLEMKLSGASAASPTNLSNEQYSPPAGLTPASSSNRRQSLSTSGESISLASRLTLRDDLQSYFQRMVSVPHYDFSFRQTAGEAVAARPTMISFRRMAFMQLDDWNDTKEFYDDELAAEEHLYRIMDSGFGQGLDMTPRTIWQLQQHFVQGFLQWLPLIEVNAFSEHVEFARNGQFSRQSPSDCLVMFALAIGYLDKERHNPSSRCPEKHHPGLEYVAAGRRILAALSGRSRRCDVTILQCRVLEVCYWNMILRPVLAWDGSIEISRDCMHILSSNVLMRMEPKDQSNFHRVFWVTSMLVHELEAILKLHPIGLRQFHELVPLPLSEAEDDGLYFFAQASLRKLLMELLDIVGYRVGQIIYAPVVVAELCKQIEEWYEHLPPGVRFPLTIAPLFDLRRAFLRLQYLTLHSVIYWPSILQLLEYGANGGAHIQDRLPSLHKDAAHFMEYATKVCECCEELLMEGHLGLQFCIWAAYANACMLMIVYRSPVLNFLPEASNDRPFRKVHRVLMPWKDVRVVWRVLQRSKALFATLGLRAEEIT